MRVTFPKGVRTVTLDDGDRAAFARVEGIACELMLEPSKYSEAKDIAHDIETLLLKLPKKQPATKA